MLTINIPVPAAIHARQNAPEGVLEAFVRIKYQLANSCGYWMWNTQELSRSLGKCRQTIYKYRQILTSWGWIQENDDRHGWVRALSWAKIIQVIAYDNPQILSAWKRHTSWNRKIRIHNGCAELFRKIDVAFAYDLRKSQIFALMEKRSGLGNNRGVESPVYLSCGRFANLLGKSEASASRRLRSLGKYIQRKRNIKATRYNPMAVKFIPNAFLKDGVVFLHGPSILKHVDSTDVQVLSRGSGLLST